MNSIKNQGFVFYPSYWEAYNDYKSDDPEAAVRFLESVIGYGLNGTEPPVEFRPIMR